MNALLSQITPLTWITLFLVLSSLIIFTFKLDKKVIFYFAKKGYKWATKRVRFIMYEHEQRILKDKQKRLDTAIEDAINYSNSKNGKRIYVLEYQGDFIPCDEAGAKRFLKKNGLNTNVILSKVAAYYTPDTNKCAKNVKKAPTWFSKLWKAIQLRFNLIMD